MKIYETEDQMRNNLAMRKVEMKYDEMNHDENVAEAFDRANDFGNEEQIEKLKAERTRLLLEEIDKEPLERVRKAKEKFNKIKQEERMKKTVCYGNSEPMMIEKANVEDFSDAEIEQLIKEHGNKHLQYALKLNAVRGAEYGNTMGKYELIMDILIGDTDAPPAIISAVGMVIMKIVRFCRTIKGEKFFYHVDSIDDLIVYSAFLRGAIQKEKRIGELLHMRKEGNNEIILNEYIKRRVESLEKQS